MLTAWCWTTQGCLREFCPSLNFRKDPYSRQFLRIDFVGGLELKEMSTTRLWSGTDKAIQRKECTMSRRPSISDFLTNLEQPMPLGEKFTKLTRNLWRRVVLRQNCCGNHGEPGC